MRYRPPFLVALGSLLACNVIGAACSQAQETAAGTAMVDRAYAVDAPALKGIKVDGDLSDWPAAMPRYSLRNIRAYPPYYGVGDLQNADLLTSPDLSACFTVGYDAAEGLIYLAVIVRDDKVVVANKTAYDTDSVQVYLDGLRSELIYTPAAGDVENIKATELPAVRYTGIPGPGPIFGMKSDKSYRLRFGDVEKTKSKMAFSRNGDVTVYEWQLEAFDQYPDKPTKLEPGKRIGFDVSVVDKDVPAPAAGEEPEVDRPVFLCWGFPPQGTKGFDAGNLGEIVLGAAPQP